MKTRIFLVVIGLATMSIAFTACSSQNKKTEPTEQNGTEKVVYTCPMHPEVISDKPGKCPKCGMELVKKEPAMNMDSAAMKKM
ncbi:MAG: heavy metal-binding domain-containing protein [Bacteroidota bacterium]